MLVIGSSLPLILILPRILKGRGKSGFLILKLNMAMCAKAKHSKEPKTVTKLTNIKNEKVYLLKLVHLKFFDHTRQQKGFSKITEALLLSKLYIVIIYCFFSV